MHQATRPHPSALPSAHAHRPLPAVRGTHTHTLATMLPRGHEDFVKVGRASGSRPNHGDHDSWPATGRRAAENDLHEPV
jgi:hypothetical protein